MSYPSRGLAAATPAERGQDVRPEPTEPPAPAEQRHDIERRTVPENAEKYPGYEYERCSKCGESGRVLNPYERCPEDER